MQRAAGILVAAVLTVLAAAQPLQAATHRHVTWFYRVTAANGHLSLSYRSPRPPLVCNGSSPCVLRGKVDYRFHQLHGPRARFASGDLTRKPGQAGVDARGK